MKKPADIITTKPNNTADAKLGMWFFLITELLFFGGLFLLYSVYRSKYPHEFHSAAMEENIVIGATNTVILITSSLTMALSISAVKRGGRNLSSIFQATTMAFGLLFLVNKYFEWSAKIGLGIYPGSPSMLQRDKGEVLFYGLYYVMTGIHGLHVIIGIGVISVTLFFTHKGTITSGSFIKLENTGLYWHFVDIVWIYLFPLFYLIT
ncbi:MAG: cytochrome c oxidase subunit 3 family protein [Deltaproteobacteria bacterium]|nr:cytochrome c oxidase subunit 3 family protein [Deltaproteobacteria bacterium]